MSKTVQTETAPTTNAKPAPKARTDKQLHGAARDAKLRSEIKKEMKADMDTQLDDLESFIRAELEAERAASDRKFAAMMNEIAAARQPAGPGVVATAAAGATTIAGVISASVTAASAATGAFLGGILATEVVDEKVTEDGYLVRKKSTVGGIMAKEVALTTSAVIRGVGNSARDWAGVDTKGRRLDVIDADEVEGWGLQEYALATVGVAAGGAAAYGGYQWLGNRSAEMDDNVLPFADEAVG